MESQNKPGRAERHARERLAGIRPVALIQEAANCDRVPDRIPGSAKGLFTVPDDFDDPIEDFREYM